MVSLRKFFYLVFSAGYDFSLYENSYTFDEVTSSNS